jgi:hypothetical protein
MKGIVVPMTPTGSVNGRVKDRNGDPLVGVPVQVLQVAYDDAGRRTLQAVGITSADQTDDRGEYRLFHVTPGKYFVYAGNPWVNTYLWGANSPVGQTIFQESYSYAFYPGVPDSRQAIGITVDAGADVRGIDVTLDTAPPRRVLGRIVDAKTGKAPPESLTAIRLTFSDPALQGGGEYSTGEKGKYRDGFFEFRNVIPGNFAVSAEIRDSDSQSRRAYASVVVGNSDVENLIVTVPAGVSLSGRWSVDRQPPPDSRLSIRLTPVSMPPVGTEFRLWYDATLSTDGTLALELPAGDYRVSAPALPAGYYLKEARFDGTDALNRPLRFAGSEGGSLNIVLNANAGVVEGVATDNKLQFFPNARVVLVPNRNRERADLFRSATADANGRFTISNVAPGDYRVLAWEALDTNAWFDPDVIRQAEPFGMPVSVTESSRRNVSVKAQPADSR